MLLMTTVSPDAMTIPMGVQQCAIRKVVLRSKHLNTELFRWHNCFGNLSLEKNLGFLLDYMLRFTKFHTKFAHFS